MHRWSSRFRLTATVLFLAVSGLCLVLVPSLAVFGNAEDSLIYKRITGQIKPAMPLAPLPGLTNEAIAAIRDWINAGAPASSGQNGAPTENKADDASLLAYGNYR